MKMNRKIMAIGTAALASAAMCGSGLIGAVSPVANAASSTVTVSYPADNLETLDPINWSGEILVDQGTILEGLYGYNTKNQVVPKIATKAVPSDGDRVWTIYLRHNARWSNGQPVTAEDFYYAWMRLLAPNDSNGAIWAGVTNNILNGYSYHSGGVPASKVGIDVVNNYELKVTLDGAMNITGLLALSASMPLYPPDVEQHPSDWFDPQYFVGDGPYVVKSFTPNGELVLTRNHKYVGGPGYNVGNVQQINVIPAPTVDVEDYESNALDVAQINSASDYTYAKKHFKSQIHVAGQANINTLAYDHSVDPSPLDNQLVREAIAMAINRAPIANPVLDGMVGATSVFGYPGFPTYKYQHNPYSFNVAAARKLLAKAGYAGGKGIPTLQIYTQTTTNNPNSVLMGEAVAQELKSNLGINSKVEPTNATLFGELVWGGIEPGVLPGYVVGNGVANWDQTLQWPLQSDQWVTLEDSGTVPETGGFQKYAENWNFSNYDPIEVKEWGNPADNNMGTSYAQWQPLIKAATSAISYLNKWTSEQPSAYQAAENQPGTVPLTTQLKTFEASYSQAKTNTAKHAAWVSFWKWVGTYPNGGDGGASLGLVDQAYVDAHEPPIEKEMRIDEAELGNTGSATEAAKLSGAMGDLLIDSGLEIPLNYGETIYLEKPDLTGAQPNPWSWNNFYQFQYLNLK